MKTIFIFILLFGPLGWAEDFPFESSESAINDIEKGLSAKEGLKDKDQQLLDADKLSLGGSLRSDINVYQLENSTADDFLQTPNTLRLYLDGKLADDVRAYFHGKFIYDGSVDPSAATTLLPGQTPKNSYSQLDEMKIQFPLEKTVFVTLGVQKIKWGSGHFWNPTDFLNTQARDLFEKEDQRAGLNLVKLHLPVRAMNFYAISDIGKTNQTKNIGTALRAELPFAGSLLNGEFSFSQYSKRGAGTLYGVDLSTGVGPIDLIIESARSREGQHNSTVLGLTYQWQYSEEDYLSLSLETYRNEDGADSTEAYLPLVAAGQFAFFHAARTYHLASLYLPKPGRWQHSEFVLTYIRNGVDQSGYSRLGYTWTGLRDLSLSFFAGQRTGAATSEMRLAGLNEDYAFRAEVKF